MPLEFRKNRDGSLRRVWFGRFETDGKRYCYNLHVKIAGTPPASLSLLDEGDAAFERSRGKAQHELNRIVEDARKKQGAERLVEKLYEIKTGETIKSISLDKLPDEWLKIPRKREPAERYASQCQSTLKRFVEFVRQQNPKASELAHVTRTVARSFLEAEEERGVTAKTWNDVLILLRATCMHLLPKGAIDPFSDIPTRVTKTVFRIPFTPEELKAILDAAQDDKFIRPILVTGICTAMRRGDCCLLEWPYVDLERRRINVNAAKTDEPLDIPIFPILYDELKALQVAEHKKGRKREGYVFPAQAKMYKDNPDGITWRVKKILAVALGEVAEDESALPEVSEETARKRGEEYIAKLDAGEKKERMAAVFKYYVEGKKIEEVVALTKISKGSVSGYLNEIEKAIGCAIVRGHGGAPTMAERLSDNTGQLWVERKNGTRRASVRDFHSFRVTWVTLALTAGVPMEVVRKVTGHKTAEIVSKHYFQPGHEEFRRTLHAAMPKLLMNGQKAPKDEMREILESMSAKSLKQDQKRLLALLQQ